MSRSPSQAWLTSICAITLVFASASTLFALTVHVSPNGNDANPGAAEQPVATIRKAVELTAGKQEPCEIVLHKGVYLQGEFGIGRPENRGKGALPETFGVTSSHVTWR